VPYVPLSKCSEVYGNPIWSGDICAGSDPANYADTCQGDSGGPLVLNGTTNPADHVLAGLTSYGYGCANDHPGIYTNVAVQLGWIDDTVILHNMGGDAVPKVGCSSTVGQKYSSPKNSTVHNILGAGECCNACKVGAGCVSWTWQQSTKTCVLLQGVPQRKLATGWTSGNITG